MTAEMWTILDENNLPVLEFTSFISLDAANASKITNYSVEKGSFTTYNKIVTPNELTVTLAVQGDTLKLQNAIDILNTLYNEAQIVNIVSPYSYYAGYSLERFDYSFNQTDGVGILITPLNFKEIRQVQAAYTNSIKYTKNKSASSKVNTGKKQGKYQSLLSKTTEKFTGSGVIY